MIKTNTVYQIEKFYEGMKKYWHPVCSFKKLKYKKIIPIQLLGEQIVILFLQGETAALLDVCKHYQAQLSLGKIDKFKGNDISKVENTTGKKEKIKEEPQEANIKKEKLK